MKNQERKMLVFGGFKFVSLKDDLLTLVHQETDKRHLDREDVYYELKCNEKQVKFMSEITDGQFVNIILEYNGNEYNQAESRLIVKGDLVTVARGQGYSTPLAVFSELFFARDLTEATKGSYLTTTIPLNHEDEVEWMHVVFGRKTDQQARKMNLRKSSFVSMSGEFIIARNTDERDKGFATIFVSAVDFIRQ